MKKHEKISLNLSALVLALGLIGPMAVFAAPTAVNLLSAGNFAILAGSTITNTGSSVISGGLGLTPGSAVTGFPPGTVVGTQYVDNTTAVQAETDLTTAYTDAAGRSSVSTIPSQLGGTTETSGVYNSIDGTFGITGTLTLDAQGNPNAVFIFQAASTLTTASASSIVLINGAQACNVFWQVGSSATLGTNSIFKGNILALQSITLTTGANVEGSALARNGAVTLDDNIVTKATCALPPPAPTPVVTPLVTPVVVVPPTTTTVTTVTATPAPTLPNTGFPPESQSIPWNIIAPAAIIAALFSFYLARKKGMI